VCVDDVAGIIYLSLIGEGGDRAPPRVLRGRTVQVEPMKSMLKAPGTKRLKLHNDEPPPNVAFKFNLRRYSVGLDPDVEETAAEWFQSLGYRVLTGENHLTKGFWAGAYTRSRFRST